ncbi:MAG: hypothetical protein ACYCXF_07210 [Thermoleophilia bacterium]
MEDLRATIVIPTYWRGPVSEAPLCTVESDYRYDHATPLDSEGTLARTLASLAILDGHHEFAVAVVAAATREEIKQAVEIKVRTIVAQFDYDFPILLIGPDELVLWRRRLAERGMGEYDQFLSLDGCPNIRNMSLLAAFLTGADVAILCNDDEVFDDPGYLDKALEFIGGDFAGGFIGGVAGYYQESVTGADPGRPELKWESIWGSIRAMNEAAQTITAPPRLKKTSLSFGGNMVIHRLLFEKIPFDVMVPRGEDIDYVLNCNCLGYDFYLDNELRIRHLPPPSCAPPWFEMRQDIIRFARERAKLASTAIREAGPGLTAADYDPYPGRFLKEDFHDLVLSTSLEMAGAYLAAGLESDARECMVNVAISKAEITLHRDAWQEYLAYQQKWEEFMRLLPAIGIWSPISAPD